MHIRLIIFFVFFGSFTFSQNRVELIEKKVMQGDFATANHLIDEIIRSEITYVKKAKVWSIKGDMSLIIGDMDSALESWNKAAYIRDKLYPNKSDYRNAWKYAHRSCFYYERFDSKLAKQYADSAAHLLKGISLEQQKEVEIHLIWNILAQSYKLQAKSTDLGAYDQVYDEVQALYEKSIRFQKAHVKSNYHLANTYHLLANTFFDNCHVYRVQKDDGVFKNAFENANRLYDLSIATWTSSYSERHYGKAKTTFLKALLYHFFGTENEQPEHLSRFYFKKALTVFGVNQNEASISQVPNKEDLLMCFKYYTNELLSKSDDQPGLLQKAKQVNQQAIICWKLIHKEQKGVRTNQNLGLYDLIPHQETIAIGTRLKKEDQDLNELFIANQKLKYYDLVKNKKSNKIGTIRIEELQKKLGPKEVFLDFHTSFYNRKIYIFEIKKKAYRLLEVSIEKNDVIQTFVASIASRNSYVEYTFQAYSLFKTLFPDGIEGNDRYVLSTDNWLNHLPFEALLVTMDNIQQGDYRKLDYLIKHVEIKYTFSPSMYYDKVYWVPNKLSAFSPSNTNENVSKLPFSKKLVATLGDDFGASIFQDEAATYSQFTNCASPIMHLSAHGLISKERQGDSRIILSDRPFKINDVSNMKHLPPFMVLNNCNSGLGRVVRGDGIDGFVRAFHEKGVKTTLSTLWEIDDKTTSESLAHFYTLFLGGKTSTEALRLSQLKQIKDAENSDLAAPYYWSGNRLLGKNLKVISPKTNLQSYLLLGGTLLLMLLISLFIYWRKARQI